MTFGPRRSTMNWTKRCCTTYPREILLKHAKVWLHFSKGAIPGGSTVPRQIHKYGSLAVAQLAKAPQKSHLRPIQNQPHPAQILRAFSWRDPKGLTDEGIRNSQKRQRSGPKQDQAHSALRAQHLPEINAAERNKQKHVQPLPWAMIIKMTGSRAAPTNCAMSSAAG